jgi:hypothetical protein
MMDRLLGDCLKLRNRTCFAATDAALALHRSRGGVYALWGGCRCMWRRAAARPPKSTMYRRAWNKECKYDFETTKLKQDEVEKIRS